VTAAWKRERSRWKNRVYALRQREAQAAFERRRDAQLVALGQLAVGDEPRHVAPELARGMAAMLVAAADQAEAAGVHRVGVRPRVPAVAPPATAPSALPVLPPSPLTPDEYERRRREQLAAAAKWEAEHGDDR